MKAEVSGILYVFILRGGQFQKIENRVDITKYIELELVLIQSEDEMFAD